MYCKHCGHRSAEKTDVWAKCGPKISPDLELSPPEKPRLRWQIIATTAVLAIFVFAIIPRVFLRTDIETIGPTDKLRFLRAMERSEYRRIGQRGILAEGQTLIVVW